MGSKSDLEAIAGAILGFIGLVALAKILSETRCPRCNTSNPNSNVYCQQCGFLLK